MLSAQRIKELLGEPNMSDTEAELVRDDLRLLAEIAFEQQQYERLIAKNKNENKQTEQIL